MKQLIDKEEQVMQILWKLERAFLKEIMAELPEPHPPVTTVASIVRKLEREAFIGHETFGKSHRYFPLFTKEEYRRKAFKRFVQDYFGGSPRRVLSFFVEEEKIEPEELDRLLDELRDQETND